MSEIIFDKPRFDEMDGFLNHIYTIAKDNPDLEITSHIVYRELCKYSLDTSDFTYNGERKMYPELFQQWIRRNRENGNFEKGLKVEHYQTMVQFLQFYSRDGESELDNSKYYIKLYIPMKTIHIYENVNELFDFITNGKMIHASKVADRARTDNVIVRLRLDDFESALKIIEFVNKRFPNFLNKSNPFIPTIKGIGLMKESGISYNSEISSLISLYINTCIKNNKTPSINEYIEWFKNNCNNAEVLDVFLSIFKKEKKESKKAIFGGLKQVIHVAIDEKNKKQIFIDALNATYKKYGLNQSIRAITCLIYTNNYSFFTNGYKEYRKKMESIVTSDDVIRYISNSLGIKNAEINHSMIELYCYKLFSKDILNTIIKSCLVTLINHNEYQLHNALKYAILNEDYNGFSRYNKNINDGINYRVILSEFSNKSLYDFIKLSLGIEVSRNDLGDIDRIIHMFIEKYIIPNKELYENVSNTK